MERSPDCGRIELSSMTSSACLATECPSPLVVANLEDPKDAGLRKCLNRVRRSIGRVFGMNLMDEAGPTWLTWQRSTGARQLCRSTSLRAIAKRQKTDSRAVRIEGHDGTFLELHLVLSEDGRERRRRLARQDAVRPELDDAWPVASCQREKSAEVEVVGEHHEPVPLSPVENLSVRSASITD